MIRLLLLLAPILQAQAASAWQRVVPLQFHCGVQAKMPSGFHAYGVLVFRARNNPSLSEVAFFQENVDLAAYHPFCATIEQALANHESLGVILETADGLNRLVTVAPAGPALASQNP